MEQTIPAGTVVKIGGMPFELLADVQAESATPLETAMNSKAVSSGTNPETM